MAKRSGARRAVNENTAPVLDNTVKRENFAHFLSIPLRWIDNDMYGHLNNARYYSLYENTIMHFHGVIHRLDTENGPVRCFSAENGCRYYAPVKFPATVDCGLRVAHLGNSSVRYELGLFIEGETQVAATGFAAEIFVDVKTERPVRIPDKFRSALASLMEFA